MLVHDAIERANSLLPGSPSPDGENDPRWQAIIAIGEYVASYPDDVWTFVSRWGCHEQDDIRDAVATCLLEHLLEHHFELIFPRVSQEVGSNRRFADTFCRCWKFGQSEIPENAAQFDTLIERCRDARVAASHPTTPESN